MLPLLVKFLLGLPWLANFGAGKIIFSPQTSMQHRIVTDIKSFDHL